MVKVYYSPQYKTYIIKSRGKGVRVKFHDIAHMYIAQSINDKFTFYFVLTQPDVEVKTNALINVLSTHRDVRDRIGVLISYALMDKTTLNCVKRLKEFGVRTMLDSGAFHVLEKKIPLNKYLSYLDEYINFINNNIDLFDYVVNLDIPADSRPAKSIQELPNKWKIEITVENACRIVDSIVDPRKFMIVIQGYYPHEYAYCCKLYKQCGLVTHRVGIGSLCIRKYDGSTISDVYQILKTVRENMPGWVKLHAFGLNIRFLKHREITQLINSSDSDAWVYSYSRFGRMTLIKSTGTFIEIDIEYMTRRGKAIGIDRETIYMYAIMSYIEYLRKIGLI